nr:type 1 glutamine amidotransferase domain-containing protein [Lacticaseibacillus thailandensis]
MVEDVEFTDPVQALKDAGHDVTVIGYEKNTITGKHGLKVAIDTTIGDVKPSDFDALFIPGGFSPDQLREDQRFVDFTRDFLLKGKVISAICHGPQLMIPTGLVHGRTMTAFKTVQVDLYYAGARTRDQEVVVDDNLITSREPKDLPAFDKALLAALAK